MKWFLLIAPLLFLAACATLNESECRGGDWYSIGFKDGKDGRQNGFMRQHAEACAEYGIRPDQKDWARGRAEGLKLYCTPERAFREGRRGQHLSPVCPASDVAFLTRENERGLRLNRVESEIRSIEGEIRGINAELADLPADDPSRSSLVSERSFLRLDLLHLRNERARLL